MNTYDTINATLEIVSIFMLLPTIMQALKTRLVVGCHWITPVFYCLWNYWNAIWWYPHLQQYGSCLGSVIIAIANTYWVWIVFRFTPRDHFRMNFFWSNKKVEA